MLIVLMLMMMVLFVSVCGGENVEMRCLCLLSVMVLCVEGGVMWWV